MIRYTFRHISREGENWKSPETFTANDLFAVKQAVNAGWSMGSSYWAEDENAKLLFGLGPKGETLTGKPSGVVRSKSLSKKPRAPRKARAHKVSDKLREQEHPTVMGIELDPRTLLPVKRTIDLHAPGDYGADPIGDGTFRMVPSGDVVSYEERNRRLEKHAQGSRSHAMVWR